MADRNGSSGLGAVAVPNIPQCCGAGDFRRLITAMMPSLIATSHGTMVQRGCWWPVAQSVSSNSAVAHLRWLLLLGRSQHRFVKPGLVVRHMRDQVRSSKADEKAKLQRSGSGREEQARNEVELPRCARPLPCTYW